MKNGLVIPCYNEAGRLKFDQFQAFLNENNSYKLCFVNDGSKDNTLEQLLAFAIQNPERVLVFDMPQNGGKAEAVRQGVNYILENTEVQNVGFIDADLATGFEDYSRLVSVLRLGQYSMVLGSRKMESQHEIERSGFRRLASFIVGCLIKLIIGMPIKDTQCGAKVFSRKAARQIFKTSFMSRWLFDVEMLIRIKNIFGNRVMDEVKEVGLNKWEEVEGSKITLRDSIKFPLQLLEIGFDYKVKPAVMQIQIAMSTYTTALFSKAA